MLLVAVLVQSSARAGPPFVTNDPDPPEVGQWEVNLPWTLKRAQDGDLSGELVTFDPNYGYDRFTQLSIELPIPYSGYFGINPQLTLPTGEDERGLGTGRITLQLPLLYQRQWGDRLFYGDLRYKWRAGEEGKSFWFLGFAMEQQVSAGLTFGAEVFGTTPQAAEGEYNVSFSVGGRYTLLPGQVLMVSAGRSLRSDPDLALFLGIRVLMPP